MPDRNFTNLPVSRALAAPKSAGTAGAVDTIQVSGASPFATQLVPPYTVVIERGTATEEVFLVTGESGSNPMTLTGRRGFGFTGANAHSAGGTVEPAMTSRDLARFASEDLDNSDFKRLLPFYNALLSKGSSPIDVLCMGDSIFEGYGLSNWADSLPQQLGARLRSLLPVAGASGARGFVGIQSDMVHHPFWPQVYTGGSVQMSGYATNMRFFQMTATGHKMVHTVQAGGITGFDIHHFQNSASSVCYYKIDGGASVPFTVAANATLTPVKLGVVAAVGSTIEIGWTSGGPYSVLGVTEYKGDQSAGIRVHQCGFSGIQAADWLTNSVLTWPECQALLTPKLIIVNLGTNDARIAAGNASAASFKATLLSLLNVLHTRVSTTAPIMVSMVYDTETNPAVPTFREPWEEYVWAAKEAVAQTDYAFVVDHSARMPGAGSTDLYGLFNAASLPHASPKGYAMMAETEASVLVPDDRYYRTMGGTSPMESVDLGTGAALPSTFLAGDRSFKEPLPSLLFGGPTLANDTVATTEVAVASWTIPANSLGPASFLQGGWFGQVSSTATLTFRIRIGPAAVQLASRSLLATFATSAAGVASAHAQGDFFVSMQGATAITASGLFSLASASLGPLTAAYAAGTVDPTVANILSITCVQSAAQTLTSRAATLTKTA